MKWTDFERLVVLTGAGISAASGLGTYRGSGGLWEESGIDPAATAEGMGEDPWGCWQFFLPMRERILRARPNPAHLALADLHRRLAGGLTLITQNVDGLHTEAGSPGVLELHGNLNRTRCTHCDLKPFQDPTIHEKLPICPECDSPLRPDIVLFGEAIPLEASHRAKRALREVDLFVAVGTSGTVAPANRYIRSAQYVGARTLEINLECSGEFDLQLEGPAESLVPEWVNSWPEPRRLTVLFSDVHGKVEPLKELLDRYSEARFVLVGDALGAGDNQATLDLLRASGVHCLRGNHEVDLLEVYKKRLSQEALDWICTWPLRFVEEDFHLVHTRLDEEGVVFHRIENRYQAKEMFETYDFRVAFVGHSHSPGYWQLLPEQDPLWVMAAPDLRLEFDGESRYIVDVGSLGEPLRSDHPNHLLWDAQGATWKRL